MKFIIWERKGNFNDHNLAYVHGHNSCTHSIRLSQITNLHCKASKQPAQSNYKLTLQGEQTAGSVKLQTYTVRRANTRLNQITNLHCKASKHPAQSNYKLTLQVEQTLLLLLS